MLLDARTDEPVVPNGSLGHRFGDAGVGRWNLDLEDVDPKLSLADTARTPCRAAAPLRHPRRRAADMPRGVPVRRIGAHLVTTVYDLMLRSTASGETACRQWPTSTTTPCRTPRLAGADHRRPGRAAARIAREFAQNAEESGAAR